MNKLEIIKNINSGIKCNDKCVVHTFITHNTCVGCKALKDSPYHKDYLKDKTDDEIAEEILELNEEFGACDE
ncbi:MAG: hypothetical protein PHV37_01870 [Candidatus Gastranaerophilales bacterium]|nr:hypothetical protein [Candidatus Gastranaerophilales bacterium]